MTKTLILVLAFIAVASAGRGYTPDLPDGPEPQLAASHPAKRSVYVSAIEAHKAEESIGPIDNIEVQKSAEPIHIQKRSTYLSYPYRYGYYPYRFGYYPQQSYYGPENGLRYPYQRLISSFAPGMYY